MFYSQTHSYLNYGIFYTTLEWDFLLLSIVIIIIYLRHFLIEFIQVQRGTKNCISLGFSVPVLPISLNPLSPPLSSPRKGSPSRSQVLLQTRRQTHEKHLGTQLYVRLVWVMRERTANNTTTQWLILILLLLMKRVRKRVKTNYGIQQSYTT